MVIIVVLIGLLVLVIIIIVVIVLVVRKKKRSRVNSHSHSLIEPHSALELHTLVLDDIVIKERLGGGNFGDVFRGDWNGTAVALKLLKSEDHFKEFQREAEMLQ